MTEQYNRIPKRIYRETAANLATLKQGELGFETDTERLKIGTSGGNKEPKPKAHGGIHTDGTDDIQDATASQKGLMTAAQASKLNGIEAGATADQTGTEIKTAYEAQANTNAYTDAEKSKLAGIESGATADQSDSEIEAAYNAQVAQVSSGEKTDGTETAVRRFSPDDVADMIATHGGGGAVIQVVSDIDGTLQSGTTLMVADDTIPQNTEGDEYYSVSITPQSATSTLVILVNLTAAGYGQCLVALFKDSESNALAASGEALSGVLVRGLTLQHSMTSGTTSSITFKVRAGVTNAGQTMYINGKSTGRILGGKSTSGIIVMELEGS